MHLKYMYITNDCRVAQMAERNSVDRIFVDLEILGKEERQVFVDSVKSHHSVADVRKIKDCLSGAELMVRVNPMNKDSKDEINRVIDNGADVVMLPMYRTIEDVEKFVSYVNGRTIVMLLLETIDAEKCLEKTLDIEGVDEIHIGLNDLHLAYKLNFMFELLVNGKIDEICSRIHQKGIPFGFGGVATLDKGLLCGRNVIAEHFRIGSSRAILSRSFCDCSEISDWDQLESFFSMEMRKLRSYENQISGFDQPFFNENREKVREIVGTIVNNRINAK